MKIINASRELNKIEQYLMTVDKGSDSMKNIPDGTSITVKAWCIYEDEKEDGTVNKIMAILTPENTVFSLQSTTFMKSIMNIHDVFGETGEYSVIKTSGKTKAGRDFIDCRLDVDSVKE